MDATALFAAVAGLSLPAAAARFAAAGVPVFPCVPGGKRPLTGHGFHDATTDRRQIRAWWGRWPEANIGLPTGPRSGVDVVDVDRRPGGSGFAAFGRARTAGLVPGWLALVRTPSGGLHVYFPTWPARAQPSWQAARPHIDFRGTGGYVLAPPSKVGGDGHPPAAYLLASRGVVPATPVDAAALRAFLDPRPTPASPHTNAPMRAEAARLAGWVTRLTEGERNRGLFWAACRLAENGLPCASTLETLGPAGQAAGLPAREITATIRSAYRTTGSGSVPARHDPNTTTSGHDQVSAARARREGPAL